MMDRDSPVTEDELHAYVDGGITDRLGTVESGCLIRRMPALPNGGRRPTHSHALWRGVVGARVARFDRRHHPQHALLAPVPQP
jgi:hypothetical protein